MLIAPLPADEERRLARLRELLILDSPPEPLFDSIARMASQVCGTPIAMLSLVDENRQWFKAKVGLDEDLTETPRDIAFCAHAIFDNSLFEVEDATLDARFADNPLVIGKPDVRFYAGAPLVMPGGERIGTLCVIDHEAGKLTAAQGKTMRELAALASQALAMRSDLIDRTLRVRGEYEQQLAAAADEMADLYANAPCGYYSVDSERRIVRINDTALGWLGASREELVGKSGLTPFLTEEGSALMSEVFPRLLRDGRVDDVQFELVNRNGERRHVALTSTAVRRPDGSFLMSRSVLFDVTELMQTRTALRRLASEQQMILDTDLIGLAKLRERKVVWANRGVERMLGYEPGSLLGKTSRVLYSDDETFARIGLEAYPIMRAGGEYRTQLAFLRADGRTIWIELRAMAEPGHPDEFMCMLADITALRLAEQARLRATELEAENRQLLESHRLKNLFLSNMSHELHTPLNAVIGYAHVLQSGSIRPEAPKFGDFLGKIAASGRELLGLIDTMLNYARAESGKFVFHPEPVDLRAVVEEVGETLGREMRAKQIEFEADVAAELGELHLDELRLTQVISHYLSNAVKFSRPGGRVVLRARAEPAMRFRIEVEDEGIGIEAADLPRLFTSFQQLNEGASKAYSGAGLSLALTKRLVEAQGGSVGASSRPGEGSTFFLVLPQRCGMSLAP